MNVAGGVSRNQYYTSVNLGSIEIKHYRQSVFRVSAASPAIAATAFDVRC